MFEFMPPMGPFMGGGFGPLEFESEIIYSFVIIVCSLMIYFGTKELYELSSYKGINYFRKAFLFFALAYFFRSFIKFVIVYFGAREIMEILPAYYFGAITLFVFMYFSAMAVFYLLYSVMWKKWSNEPNRIYLFHGLALIIAAITTVTRSPLIRFGMNFLLFLFVAVVAYYAHTEANSKKGHGLYAIYLLLLLFWIFNILDILTPHYLQTFQLFVYLASSCIFLTILYKVIKKTGSS